MQRKEKKTAAPGIFSQQKKLQTSDSVGAEKGKREPENGDWRFRRIKPFPARGELPPKRREEELLNHPKKTSISI